MEKINITNEQKLYVLLNSTPSMSEYESDIWYVVHSSVSPDDNWFNDVAKVLTASEYLTHGWAFCGNESREVWSITSKGRGQIPILWNGSELKKLHDEETKALEKESSFGERHKVMYKILWKIIDALIGAIVGSIITYIVLKQR